MMKSGFLRMLSCVALLITLCFAVTSLPGCGTGKQNTTEVSVGTLISEAGTFDKNSPPALIAVDGENIWMMQNAYGKADVTLSCGPSFDQQDRVTLASWKEALVWNLTAANGIVAWAMNTQTSYEIMAWTATTGFVTVQSMPMGESNTLFQEANVVIYDTKVIYTRIDYEHASAEVLSYDFSDWTRETILTLPFHGNQSVQALSLNGKTLSVVTATDDAPCAYIVNLKNGKSKAVALPEEFSYVFGVDYDASSGRFAFYYADKDGHERIGTMKNGKFKWLLDLHESYYAYRDVVFCRGNTLYWVVQADVSGEVANHYRLCVFDTKTNRCTEYPAAFHVAEYGDQMIYLAFVDGEVAVYSIP